MNEVHPLENHLPARLGKDLADELEATYLKDDLLARIKGHGQREGLDGPLLLAHTKFVQAAGVATAVLGAVADRKEAHQVLEAFYAALQNQGFLATDFEKENFDAALKAYEEVVWDSNNFGSPLTPALVGRKFAEAAGKQDNEILQKFGMAHFVERMRIVFQKLYILPHGIRLNPVSQS
jgi:hypothetical protein